MEEKEMEQQEITEVTDEITTVKEILVKLQELKGKLEGQRRKLMYQENSLRQDITRKNNEIEQLERKIEQIAKENDKLTKRIRASTRLPQVMQQKYFERKDDLQIIYPQYVRIVLHYMKLELDHILKCPATEVVPEEKADTRETYKVYGLLLSACALRKRDAEPAIVNQVVKYTHDKYKRRETTHVIKDYVVKAASLTHDMLTLLPPLLITTEIKKFNEALHDVNRATWNDAMKRKECLIYYRPILVHGNQLHIAEKGLVGNKIEEEQKKQHCQQKLQQSGLQKGLREHQQIEKQHQQAQVAVAIKCAACKKELYNGDEGSTLEYEIHLELFWHKDHYKCSSCHKKVDENFKYIEDGDLVYCSRCSLYNKDLNDTQPNTGNYNCTSV